MKFTWILFWCMIALIPAIMVLLCALMAKGPKFAASYAEDMGLDFWDW